MLELGADNFFEQNFLLAGFSQSSSPVSKVGRAATTPKPDPGVPYVIIAMWLILSSHSQINKILVLSLVLFMGRGEGQHPDKGDLRLAGKRGKEQLPFII